MTQERSLLRCPGVRLTVYACRVCLAEIAFFLWFFHEFPLRAAMLAREKAEAGEPEYCYEKSFAWQGANGFPQPTGRAGMGKTAVSSAKFTYEKEFEVGENGHKAAGKNKPLKERENLCIGRRKKRKNGDGASCGR
jgi:hypothetical protein